MRKGGIKEKRNEWSVDANAPTTLLLELNVPTRLTFKAVNVAIRPPLTLAANLIVQLDPVHPHVPGGAEHPPQPDLHPPLRQPPPVPPREPEK